MNLDHDKKVMTSSSENLFLGPGKNFMQKSDSSYYMNVAPGLNPESFVIKTGKENDRV